MRGFTLALCFGLLASPLAAAPAKWHTDYSAAYAEAKEAKKLLLLVFDSDEHRLTFDSRVASRLRDFVRLRLSVDDSEELLAHVGLRHFHAGAGIGVIDLKNEGPNYGRVVQMLPAEYVTPEGTDAMLKMAQGKAAQAAGGLPKLRWLTDYKKARAQAERQNKMLLIAVDSQEEAFAPKPESIPALLSYVLLRQQVDSKPPDDGEPLIDCADFEPLRGAPGLIVYDFRNKDAPYYGEVVGVMPYKYLGPDPGNRVFGEKEREREFLVLEPNTLSARTLTWAIRVSKGYGENTRLRSADGRSCPVLMSWALKNSQLQCRYGCGHHAGGPMRSEIASPGPGQDIVDGALNMVRIWRSSPPHYRSMVGYHRQFGYDMHARSQTYWYGTGRF